MTKLLRPTLIVLPILSVLALLAALIILAAASRNGVNQTAVSAAELPGDTNLSLLSGAAYLFLLAGASGLRTAFQQRRKQTLRAFRWSHILLLAFFFPFLINVLPGLVAVAVTWTTQPYNLLGIFLGLHPWLPILQGFALVILLLAGGEIRLAPRTPPWNGGGMASAALWGLGLWLVFVFAARLAGIFMPLQIIDGLRGSPTLTGLSLIAGLILLPVGEEIFFRGRLLDMWQTRFGPTAGSLLSASVFALACLRPVLWLPAFLIGIGLNRLANQTKGLQACILAHVTINMLVLFIFPAILI